MEIYYYGIKRRYERGEIIQHTYIILHMRTLLCIAYTEKYTYKSQQLREMNVLYPASRRPVYAIIYMHTHTHLVGFYTHPLRYARMRYLVILLLSH